MIVTYNVHIFHSTLVVSLNRISENPWKIPETTVCLDAYPILCYGESLHISIAVCSWLRSAGAKTWPENKPNRSDAATTAGFGGLVLMPVLSTVAKLNHLEYSTNPACIQINLASLCGKDSWNKNVRTTLMFDFEFKKFSSE